MVPAVRIELTTYRLQGGCSTAELSRRRDGDNRAGARHQAALPRTTLNRRAGGDVWRATRQFGGDAMSILGWIVLGLIAGWIGGKIVNRHGAGFFLNIVLGIVGAFVGGLIFSVIGGAG